MVRLPHPQEDGPIKSVRHDEQAAADGSARTCGQSALHETEMLNLLRRCLLDPSGTVMLQSESGERRGLDRIRYYFTGWSNADAQPATAPEYPPQLTERMGMGFGASFR